MNFVWQRAGTVIWNGISRAASATMMVQRLGRWYQSVSVGLVLALCLPGLAALSASPQENVRSLRFRSETVEDAKAWQQKSRERLYQLMMGGAKPERVPLAPEILCRVDVPAGGYVLEELKLQTTADRSVHVWLAMPKRLGGKVPAVLALHGHGGSGEEVVRGKGLYWYGRALAEMGYAVISPDIGSHELQHADWTLMGERAWDALRCVDYLESRPEVDANRMAVVGLSLGGETAMYVAALDERIKAACSSGWLTTTENMRAGHCKCWDFPGLEQHFDFSDIFACVAPRPLVFEIGQKEKAPGGFPIDVARKAFAEVQRAYRVFGADERVRLDEHPGGHVFRGAEFWEPLHETLGTPPPWSLLVRGEPGRADGKSESVGEGLRRGEIARRNFCRALGVLDGWWAIRDPEIHLFPRRLDQPVWAPQDNAADMLPFLFLTAHYLAPERITELSRALESEKQLTSRLGPLPDWYSIPDRRFVHEQPDVVRIIFNAAEYCKDGLIPMTEVMGRGPWTERMIELMDAIFEHAPIASGFGQLPANDTEVNGDILQTLARLIAMTRDSKYLQWAERIGDAYCLEVLPRNGGLPPHRWDFEKHQTTADTLNLNDHGNELIGGLAELYTITQAMHPEKAKQYREPLRAMFHRLLDTARNEDGLWFNLVRASTGEPLNRATPDTWGYALAATVTFATATQDAELLRAVEQTLHKLDQPRYLDWNGADAYADSIEGALLVLKRMPVPDGFRWLEKMLPIFLGKQRDDGIVEGWYGDGNYARTALMAGLYYTQGTMCRPWRNDLRWGAVPDGSALRVVLEADESWDGKLCFDQPRHRTVLRLPVNYPRLNEFPEWFAVEPDVVYRVHVGANAETTLSGKQLAEGLPLRLNPNEPVVVRVESSVGSSHPK